MLSAWEILGTLLTMVPSILVKFRLIKIIVPVASPLTEDEQ
jgi:hypothetical protein